MLVDSFDMAVEAFANSLNSAVTLQQIWNSAIELGRQQAENALVDEIEEQIEYRSHGAWIEGIEEGRDQERKAWGAAEHSNKCITVAQLPQKISVQTKNPLLSIPTTYTDSDPPLTFTTTESSAQMMPLATNKNSC